MSKGAQFSAPEPSEHVMSPVSVFCDSHDHLVEQCTGLPVIKAEQANVLSSFHKPNPNNNPFSEIYNPRWRNHPNLSWKPSQGQGYDETPPFQELPPNNQFHQGNQFAVAPFVPPYVLHNQGEPSLEDMFQQFMQSQTQTNQNQIQVNDATSQAIAKIDVQLGQIAASVGEREKGQVRQCQTREDNLFL